MPDTEGRDRKHNAEGFRNDLKNIRRNLKKGENISDFLEWKGWNQKQIDSFIETSQNYIEYNLPNDVELFNISEDLAMEINSLAETIGLIP